MGLELTRQLLDRGDHVIACCRRPDQATALVESDALTVLPLDVTDPQSINELPAQLENRGLALDVLINNAGIAEQSERLGNLDAERMSKVFLVNTIAPLLLSQALVPWLERSPNPQIFCVSSLLGR